MAAIEVPISRDSSAGSTARRIDEEGWVVITLWENPDHARHAAESAATHPVARAFESQIDPAMARGRFETLD